MNVFKYHYWCLLQYIRNIISNHPVMGIIQTGHASLECGFIIDGKHKNRERL